MIGRTLADVLGDLETEEPDCNLQAVAIYMRYAYAEGYVRGLEDPSADLRLAQAKEREAWAHLP